MALGERGHLSRSEGGPFGEEKDMNPPLVFAPTPGTGAINDYLPMADTNREGLSELIATPGLHGAGHLQVPREHSE